MAVTTVDTRTTALTQILANRFAQGSRPPNSDQPTAAPSTPSSTDVIQGVSDLLDLSPRAAAADLSVVSFEDAAFSEYLNITAALLRAGDEGVQGQVESANGLSQQTSAGVYGPDARRFAGTPPTVLDLRV